MEIEIPKRKPKVIQHETKEDGRKFAVVPYKMLLDRRLTNHAKLVMAVVCAYANRAGISIVSQARVAQDLKTHQSVISRAMAALVDCGYLEKIGNHSAGMKGRTMRIIFDPSIKTEDAIAVAQSGTEEDLRPPHQRISDAVEIIQDGDWAAEDLEANKKRLHKLIQSTYKQVNKPVPNMPYTPTKGDTIAVRKIREAIRELKQQEYAEKMLVDNSGNDQRAYMQDQREDDKYAVESYKHNKRCLYASGAYAEDAYNKDMLHSIDTQKRLTLDDVIRVFKENLFNEIKSDDVRFVEMLCQIGVTEPELVAAMDANRSATPRQIVDAVVNARV